MNTLSFIDNAFCVKLATAMGHFLWQATAVAIIALVAVRLLRGRSAQARYVVLTAALLLTAVCLPVTFAMLDAPQPQTPTAQRVQSIEYVSDTTSKPLPLPKTPAVQTPATPLQVEPISPPAAVGTIEPLEIVQEAPTEKPAGETAATWQRYAPHLAACYAVCVAGMLVRLLAGLHGGRRLRQGAQPARDGAILTAVARIAANLRMRVAPAVAYCRRVAVPTVVGVLRPMVLLPVTFATGLSGEQVTAILTHELAHIRRWDHVINLLQRVIEAVLFFHPAVWLLSRRIRIERENCCDDVVVSTGSKAHHYAESLIRVAELGLAGRRKPAASAALAATDKPSLLRRRIARLLGVSADKHETQRLRRTWPAAAVLVALVTIATVFISCQSKETPKPESNGLAAAYKTLKNSPYLSDLRSSDPEINRYIADLRSSDKKIRYEAMSALGFVGPEAISAIPELARLFKDRVGDEKGHARTALEKIIASIPATGSVTSYTTPEINRYVADLRSSDKKVRFEAVRALGEMGPAAAPAVPALLMDMVGNKINRGRGYTSNADSALREINLPLPRDVPSVAGMLKDDSMHVRQLALQLLGGLAYRRGGDGILESVIPQVVEQLSVSDFSVQSWAVNVLHHLGPRAASATGTIATLLTHKDPWLRGRAAEALAAIGPGAREAVPDLARALSDPNPNVRFFAAMALGDIGPDAAAAAPQLAELALRPSDIKYGSDVEAMNALRRIGPSAMEELKKTAAGTDDTARSARAVLERFRSSQVKGWVKKFINNKYRNVAIWNAVKWGKAETNSDGNLSIRCKYLVTRGKDNQLFEQVFTFTPEGEYVGVETLSKKPAEEIVKPESSPSDNSEIRKALLAGVKEWSAGFGNTKPAPKFDFAAICEAVSDPDVVEDLGGSKFWMRQQFKVIEILHGKAELGQVLTLDYVILNGIYMSEAPIVKGSRTLWIINHGPNDTWLGVARRSDNADTRSILRDMVANADKWTGDFAQTAKDYSQKIAGSLLAGWAATVEDNVITVTRNQPVEWYNRVSLPTQDKAELKEQGFIQSGTYAIRLEFAPPISYEQAVLLEQDNERIRLEYYKQHPVSPREKPNGTPKELLDQLHRVPDILTADFCVFVTKTIEKSGWIAFYDNAVGMECDFVESCVRNIVRGRLTENQPSENDSSWLYWGDDIAGCSRAFVGEITKIDWTEQNDISDTGVATFKVAEPLRGVTAGQELKLIVFKPGLRVSGRAPLDADKILFSRLDLKSGSRWLVMLGKLSNGRVEIPNSERFSRLEPVVTGGEFFLDEIRTCFKIRDMDAGNQFQAFEKILSAGGLKPGPLVSFAVLNIVDVSSRDAQTADLLHAGALNETNDKYIRDMMWHELSLMAWHSSPGLKSHIADLLLNDAPAMKNAEPEDMMLYLAILDSLYDDDIVELNPRELKFGIPIDLPDGLLLDNGADIAQALCIIGTRARKIRAADEPLIRTNPPFHGPPRLTETSKGIELFCKALAEAVEYHSKDRPSVSPPSAETQAEWVRNLKANLDDFYILLRVREKDGWYSVGRHVRRQEFSWPGITKEEAGRIIDALAADGFFAHAQLRPIRLLPYHNRPYYEIILMYPGDEPMVLVENWPYDTAAMQRIRKLQPVLGDVIDALLNGRTALTVSDAFRSLVQKAIAIKPQDAGFGSGQRPTGLDFAAILMKARQDKDLKDFPTDHAKQRAAIYALADSYKEWAIASLLNHENVDVKIWAAESLQRLNQPETAVALLAAAKANNYVVEGSEIATLHARYRRALKAALECLTGLKLTPKGHTEDHGEDVDFAAVDAWLAAKYLPLAATQPEAEWGEAVDDLQVSVSMDGNGFDADKEIPIRWRIRNSGKKDRAIYWHGYNYSPVLFDVTDAEGKVYPNQYEITRGDTTVTPAPPEKIILKPGEMKEGTFNLERFIGTLTGELKITGVYAPKDADLIPKEFIADKKFADAVMARIASKEITVKIYRHTAGGRFETDKDIAVAAEVWNKTSPLAKAKTLRFDEKDGRLTAKLNADFISWPKDTYLARVELFDNDGKLLAADETFFESSGTIARLALQENSTLQFDFGKSADLAAAAGFSMSLTRPNADTTGHKPGQLHSIPVPNGLIDNSDVIFIGKVIKVDWSRPQPAQPKPTTFDSNDWGIAQVQCITPVRGGQAGQIVNVLVYPHNFYVCMEDIPEANLWANVDMKPGSSWLIFASTNAAKTKDSLPGLPEEALKAARIIGAARIVTGSETVIDSTKKAVAVSALPADKKFAAFRDALAKEPLENPLADYAATKILDSQAAPDQIALALNAAIRRSAKDDWPCRGFLLQAGELWRKFLDGKENPKLAATLQTMLLEDAPLFTQAKGELLNAYAVTLLYVFHHDDKFPYRLPEAMPRPAVEKPKEVAEALRLLAGEIEKDEIKFRELLKTAQEVGKSGLWSQIEHHVQLKTGLLKLADIIYTPATTKPATKPDDG